MLLLSLLYVMNDEMEEGETEKDDEVDVKSDSEMEDAEVGQQIEG